ncbi:guanosine-3',5'-bis(diphosphate) 3'-pyrophosphohydrolase MESH1 isoform X2 [Drosophila nasuta]|uniref:guanosine-3',5'-bis(diphosphate) 3'-pyrophosphohydrolase MESH1 isoform X2 n=1 Tax=Drosophila nasuta TaxID=42062 RepID=UPI00295E68DC|nr:guanosine-3',5'-bis(diphosphate) 3'-pyrophosphohydrolase MESH1 isoform X2 [Drosophila nasuta]
MTSARFMKCLQYAAQQHRNQRRKDPQETPYINHPINVSTILATEAGIDDEAVLMAALLHDVVEDTDATFADLERLFGDDITGLVREVTDDKSLEKMERKRLQIVNAPKASRRAKLIKLADKLDNLRDLQVNTPTGWTEERREAYFVWAQRVVDGLRGTNAALEEQLDHIFRQRQLLD